MKKAGVSKVAILFLLLFVFVPAAMAQIAKQGTAGDVSCATNVATPTVVDAESNDRAGFTMINVDTVDVRVGFGTGTTALGTTNSYLLKAGAGMNDGLPWPLVSEIRCQSTDGTARTITFLEKIQTR